ncbi:MAG TPA: hypothetical protein VEQ10_03040, partial [Vicinamibacteria bacterium]|nr:hypothetical protein [Vicinamibacteria bacterium]
RRLPFGIAVRPNTALEGIDGYEYRGARVDLGFRGRGGVESVQLNGRALTHTLQVPESQLVPGRNTLVVGLGPRALEAPVLTSSTVRLGGVTALGGGVSYEIEAAGCNVLVFRGRPGLEVRDASGRRWPVRARSSGTHTAFEFEGRGRYRALAR